MKTTWVRQISIVLAIALGPALSGLSTALTGVGHADDTSPLQNNDPPPEGVAALLETFGDPLQVICQDGTLRPGDEQTLPSKEVGQALHICLEGFAPDQSILARIKRPDGAVKLVAQNGRGEWEWAALPGDPSGAYTFTATQGPLTAVGRFTVNAASRPRMLVFPEFAGAGTTLQVSLAGFGPRQLVSLRLYYSVPCPPVQGGIGKTGRVCWAYRTSLYATMDASGQTLYNLHTRPNDPIGSYRTISQPAAEGTYGFYLDQPPALPTFAWYWPKPDLVATSVEIEGKRPDATSDCDPGRNTITVLVKNSGEAPAGPFAVRVLIDGDEPNEAQEAVRGLAPAQEIALTFPTISLRRGAHGIHAIVDPDNRVAEENDANNQLDSWITCENEKG